MTLGQLIRYRRPFVKDGRRFVVSGPTYATVHTALCLYSLEAVAIAQQHKEHGNVTLDMILKAVKLDHRMVDVLATCVETEADPSEWPLEDLARVVLSLCDIERMVKLINVDRMAGAVDEIAKAGGRETGPPVEAVAVVQLAVIFKKTPAEICDWPFESILATWQCIEKLPPDMLRMMGVPAPKQVDEFTKLVMETAQGVDGA